MLKTSRTSELQTKKFIHGKVAPNSSEPHSCASPVCYNLIKPARARVCTRLVQSNLRSLIRYPQLSSLSRRKKRILSIPTLEKIVQKKKEKRNTPKERISSLHSLESLRRLAPSLSLHRAILNVPRRNFNSETLIYFRFAPRSNDPRTREPYPIPTRPEKSS